MVYLAFDMDGTLGSFMVLWTMVSRLGDGPLYDELVRRMAIREKGATPIGMFRPGIFDVMRRVAKLKRSGVVQGVFIYTNNGSLELAEFVRDVIHRVVRYAVFDDVIHFYHPLRVAGPTGKTPNQKTWFELHKLLVSGGVRAPAGVQPSEVLFFDDQEHTDLMSVLGTNYIRVPEYTYVAPIGPVIDLFTAAFADYVIPGENIFEYVGYHGTLDHYIRRLERGAATAATEATAAATASAAAATASASATASSVASDNGSAIMTKAISRFEGRRGGGKVKSVLSMITGTRRRRRQPKN
jgi:hypothetical protein